MSYLSGVVVTSMVRRLSKTTKVGVHEIGSGVGVSCGPSSRDSPHDGSESVQSLHGPLLSFPRLGAKTKNGRSETACNPSSRMKGGALRRLGPEPLLTPWARWAAKYLNILALRCPGPEKSRHVRGNLAGGFPGWPPTRLRMTWRIGRVRRYDAPTQNRMGSLLT